MKKIILGLLAFGSLQTIANIGGCMQAYVASGATATYAKTKCANFKGNTGCMHAYVTSGASATYAQTQCANYQGDGGCMQAFVADGSSITYAKDQCKI